MNNLFRDKVKFVDLPRIVITGEEYVNSDTASLKKLFSQLKKAQVRMLQRRIDRYFNENKKILMIFILSEECLLQSNRSSRC